MECITEGCTNKAVWGMNDMGHCNDCREQIAGAVGMTSEDTPSTQLDRIEALSKDTHRLVLIDLRRIEEKIDTILTNIEIPK